MSSLKDFKSIADEIMNDINVSDELKENTLARCMKRKHVRIKGGLIPAACFVLIFAAFYLSGVFSLITQTSHEGNSPIELMRSSDESGKTFPGQPDSSTAPGPEANKSVLLGTLEEGKKYFGECFSSPSYVPENFKLDKIHAAGVNGDTAAKIIISYVSGDQSFLIIEEKTAKQNGLNNYRAIDINGAAGYLKPEMSIGNKDTELHWFTKGAHYSVAGLISDDEAVRIAKSMK